MRFRTAALHRGHSCTFADCSSPAAVRPEGPLSRNHWPSRTCNPLAAPRSARRGPCPAAVRNGSWRVLPLPAAAFARYNHCICNEVKDSMTRLGPRRGGAMKDRPTLPDFDLGRFTPYRLAVAAEKTSEELARQYHARFGISIPEWRVLVHLAQPIDGAETVSVRDIEARVAMEKSKVSRAAKRLEASGHIEKT